MDLIEAVPDKPPGRQLGELIKRERVRMELSHRDVAERCGTNVGKVREWEEGESVPEGREWARIKGSLPILRAASRVWQAAIRAAAPPYMGDSAVADAQIEATDALLDLPVIPTAPVSMPPELPDPAKQRSFGAALRVARLNEGLTQEDLGELIGVNGSALSNWELEKAVPVLDNWRRLIDLLPDLSRCVPPAVQDIAKPEGSPFGGGPKRFPRAATIDQTLPQPSAASAPEDSTANGSPRRYPRAPSIDQTAPQPPAAQAPVGTSSQVEVTAMAFARQVAVVEKAQEAKTAAKIALDRATSAVEDAVATRDELYEKLLRVCAAAMKGQDA